MDVGEWKVRNIISTNLLFWWKFTKFIPMLVSITKDSQIHIGLNLYDFNFIILNFSIFKLLYRNAVHFSYFFFFVQLFQNPHKIIRNDFNLFRCARRVFNPKKKIIFFIFCAPLWNNRFFLSTHPQTIILSANKVASPRDFHVNIISDRQK